MAEMKAPEQNQALARIAELLRLAEQDSGPEFLPQSLNVMGLFRDFVLPSSRTMEKLSYGDPLFRMPTQSNIPITADREYAAEVLGMAPAGVAAGRATSRVANEAGDELVRLITGNPNATSMQAIDEISRMSPVPQIVRGKKPTEPKQTVEAFKLFRTDPNKPGELFPLFVNANKGVEQGSWVPAEIGPMTDKGRVESKIGELAFRPGWHAGDYIAATHIGGKATKGATKPEYRPANQVWASVELPADVDWQSIANSRAGVIKSGPNKGKMNAAEAQISDQIPEGGFYRYKTNPNMMGNWLIGGSMKVNKQLEPNEIKQIQEATQIFDLPSLPEFIDQQGLKFNDLRKSAQQELKKYYPEKYAELTGKVEYEDVFSNPLMEDTTK